MAFKDLLNKGVDFIQSSAKAVGDAAKEKKAAMEEFDILKTRSERVGPMNPYVVNNDDPQDGKEQMILNACLTINVENAKVINKALPIDETVIDVRTGKEAQTEIDYNLVATDKRLWIVNKNEYTTMEYDSVKDCGIINKGIMSQGVKFDNKAFVIDGNEADVKRFFDVLKNPEFRKDVTSHKIAYLAGVIPRKQVLNVNMKGITIGDNGAVVLHNNTENKLVNIKDIMTIQVLVNDTVAIARGRGESSNFMSSPMEARKMSVKVIFGMGEYVIETMPQNVMNTSYRREDGTYVANYDFAKKIVETLAGLIKDDSMNMSVASNTVVQPNNVAPQPTQIQTSPTQPVVNNQNPTSTIPTINPFTNPMATAGMENNDTGTQSSGQI